MAAIGSITVDTMSGLPEPQGDELERIERTGVDGQAYFVKGKRTKQRAILTHQTFVRASTTEATMLANYLALKGTLVTVTDAHGNTWSTCMVVDVDPQIVPVTSVTGGTANADRMIRATWLVEKVGT